LEEEKEKEKAPERSSSRAKKATAVTPKPAAASAKKKNKDDNAKARDESPAVAGIHYCIRVYEYALFLLRNVRIIKKKTRKCSKKSGAGCPFCDLFSRFLGARLAD